MRNYYFNKLFFWLFFGIVVLFAISFLFKFLFAIAQTCLFMLFVVSLVDLLLLSTPLNPFEYERIVPSKLSNGDENELIITIKSSYRYKTNLIVLDDLPYQLQLFNYRHKISILPFQKKQLIYVLNPKERGVYVFGNSYILASSQIGLLQKRHVITHHQEAACYPSFLQLKKYAFLAITNKLTLAGTKKIRSLEQNTEFSEIREYNQGDDFKHINWKSTARKNAFFVNQYQAEKAQNIYCIIDKSRSMKMPFNGQTLLDYAINASLVLCNVAIKKEDRAGILSFSRTPDGFLKADRKAHTMHYISNELYKIGTGFLESDFGRLYKFLNHKIKQRSLLLLFTNFDTYNAYERQEKYIRAIAKKHKLLLIFFENSEIIKKMDTPPTTIASYYEHTIAEQLVNEKRNILKALSKYGIQAIITKPENLTVSAVNSYLNIKNKGNI